MGNFEIVGLGTLAVLFGKIAHDLFVSTVVYFRRKRALKAQEEMLSSMAQAWEAEAAADGEA